MMGLMETEQGNSFGFRFKTALSCFFRALGDARFAVGADKLLRGDVEVPKAQPLEAKPAAAPVVPAERAHASGLAVLAHLQREGRLIDFLQEDVASFSDADVGAAARVVHAGCKKAFNQYFAVEAILKEAEGASVTVPAGFDAQRIRITGNVAGQPPFRGTLKHHGWVVTKLNMPTVSEALDPRVIAAAEVEL